MNWYRQTRLEYDENAYDVCGEYDEDGKAYVEHDGIIEWCDAVKTFVKAPVDRKEEVKKRTQELLEVAKKKMDKLAERAFLTGAFDIDYAFENDNLIPQAIVNAVCMAMASDFTNSNSKEINEEAENIYQFL